MESNTLKLSKHQISVFFKGKYFFPVVFATILMLIQSAIFNLSFSFDWDINPAQWPAPLFVALQMTAGLVFITAVYFTVKIRTCGKPFVYFIVVTGILMRLMMVFSHPIMETDANRYLWDGAQSFHLENPYRFSPAQIKILTDNELPDKIIELRNRAGSLINGINSPQLKSNYPIIAQVFFALAYAIKPFSMPAWHLVQMLCDFFTLWFLFLILRAAKFPAIMVCVYWWNPMVIKEIFNSGHMDVLIFPFLTGSLFFSIKKKHFKSAIFLALATGVKIWPVMLFPIVFANILPDRKTLFKIITIYSGIVFIIFAPVLLTGFDQRSGYVAYTHSWECNDAFFKFFVKVTHPLFQYIGISGITAKLLRRAVIISIVFAIIFYRVKKYPDKIFSNSMIVTASIFLLSPAGFPWYSTWLAPLLVLALNWPVLSLTVFLPMYYIRLYLLQHDQEQLFDNAIIWIEYMPVWGLIFYQYYKSLRTNKL